MFSALGQSITLPPPALVTPTAVGQPVAQAQDAFKRAQEQAQVRTYSIKIQFSPGFLSFFIFVPILEHTSQIFSCMVFSLSFSAETAGGAAKEAP